MLLSRETIEGLHITGYAVSFIATSEKFSQDPLEKYFGQQQSCGGWCQSNSKGVHNICTIHSGSKERGNIVPVRGEMPANCKVPKMSLMTRHNPRGNE